MDALLPFMGMKHLDKGMVHLKYRVDVTADGLS
jgi:hypothetical protein